MKKIYVVVGPKGSNKTEKLVRYAKENGCKVCRIKADKKSDYMSPQDIYIRMIKENKDEPAALVMTGYEFNKAKEDYIGMLDHLVSRGVQVCLGIRYMKALSDDQEWLDRMCIIEKAEV